LKVNTEQAADQGCEVRYLASAVGILGLGIGVVIGAPAHVARAACNLIPGTIKTFNSTLGATNRPFAAPGENVEIRLRPCDTGSPGLGIDATDHLVTVLFSAPNGVSNAVVLTAAADCSSVTPKLAACAGDLNGGVATCVADAAAGMNVVDRNGIANLSFRFPDTDDRIGGAADASR
jgi:hypothetical protein